MQLARDRWFVVLEVGEVPRRGAMATRRLGQDLVFWRGVDGAVHGAVDRCPHRGAKLSPGKVVAGELECPFHGFRFAGDGACTAIPVHPERKPPGAMRLGSFPVREAHGFVWVWTGPSEPSPEPVPFFDFAGWSWAGSGFTEPVANHHSRAVENQLDYPHLPFVHPGTIGRVVTQDMDVTTVVDGDRIRAHIGNPEVFIELLAPSIWRNKTGPAWQFLAFVPIDEQQMIYYVRTYQRVVTVPGLDWLVGALNQLVNGVILRQDTPLVESQPLGETRLRMGEVLVPSDGPIIAYRRWREALRAPWDPGRREPSATAADRDVEQRDPG